MKKAWKNKLYCLSFAILGSSFVMSLTAPCSAALLELSGRVALMDGASPKDVQVRLGVDLNRDGRFDSFEELQATVDADGSYTLSYTPKIEEASFELFAYLTELIAEFEQSGFSAVLEDGPLPLLVTFESEGYSTVTHHITTLHDLPRLDVVLDRLAEVACSSESCLSPDGAVRLSGLDPNAGIARAFARARDPRLHASYFPGEFADSENNLLISGGFAEIDLRDARGNRIRHLDRPVEVRFEADPTSWASLRDLEDNSGKIEVPMYSFDETRGDWVREANGELQDERGSPIPESSFAEILDGSFEEKVFIAFSTEHFSIFNCDAPIEERACIKGRLVVDGEPLAGQQVSFNGVNYWGSAGTFFTGKSGRFATDVMKSERSSEDVDGNRRTGETFFVTPVVLGSNYFEGGEIATPVDQGSVGRWERCNEAECDCIDLGDVELKSNAPRPCKVRVRVSASGKSVLSQESPVERGAPLENASVFGKNTKLSVNGRLALPTVDCNREDCDSARSDNQGLATFFVPATSDAIIELRADARVVVQDGMGGASSLGLQHSYSGKALVEACSEGVTELDEIVDLELDHVLLTDLDEQMKIWQEQQRERGQNGTGSQAGSGSGSGTGSGSAGRLGSRDSPGGPGGCLCAMGPGSEGKLGWLLVFLGALPFLRRRGA